MSRPTTVLVGVGLACLAGYYTRMVVERWPSAPVSLVTMVVVLTLARWMIYELTKKE